LALDATKPDFEELAKRALSDDDTVIRSLAAQRISSSDGPTFEKFLELMKRDPYMPVRREALRMAIKLGAPGDFEALRNALLDSHASMRDEARYHLRKMPAFDVAAFYREQLERADGRSVFAVVSGLGESGSAEDDSLIIPFASHPSAKIRTAAIKALATLRPNAHPEIFMNALTDEAPRVSSQAVKALRRQHSALNAARLWEIFRSTPDLHVKRNALYLIERCAKWDSIRYLLNALCETDENVIDVGRTAVDGWLGYFNRSFSSPTPDQLTAARDALEKCGHALNETTRERLQFSLKTF
jgi:HEAT repeat protein